MDAIVINLKDNVAVALIDLAAGHILKIKIDGESEAVKLVDNIPRGHKIALANVREGEPIMKYGEVIGLASRAIKRGEHIHIHNVVGQRLAQVGI